MERLNWAVLGLIGIVTALGLGTSSGEGKTKSNEQPVSVTASSSAPGCDACRIAQAEAATKVSATPIKMDEACPGNCQATGVCCDKSLPKSETTASATAFAHDTKIVCQGACSEQSKQQVAQAEQNLEALVQAKGPYVSDKELDHALAPLSSRLVEQYDPLTKAADAIANLTKPGHGTLTITAAEPVSTQPEGLSNLLAAAEATATAQSDQGPVSSTITISGEDLTKAGAGTLTLSVRSTDDKPAVAIVTETKAVESMPAIDNSRAAARAAKLAKLEEKMALPWTLAFNETPLSQAVATVQEKYGVPVLLDRKALDEAGIDLATPLTADQQPEIEAGESLRGCLQNHNLTWMIPASNDRVLITTMTAMENTPIRRVYEVTDLIGEDPETLLQQLQSVLTPITWVDGHSSNLIIRNNGPRYYLMATHDYWSQQELKMLIEDLRLQNTAK